LRGERELFCPPVDLTLNLSCGVNASMILVFRNIFGIMHPQIKESHLPHLMLIHSSLSYSHAGRKETVGFPKGFVF